MLTVLCPILRGAYFNDECGVTVISFAVFWNLTSRLAKVCRLCRRRHPVGSRAIEVARERHRSYRWPPCVAVFGTFY